MKAKTHHYLFDEHEALHELKHFLPAQAPLKDFIHHNTLHAFQHQSFYQALRNASAIFGYKVTLTLDEYRERYLQNRISEAVLERVITEKKGKTGLGVWKRKVLTGNYDSDSSGRVGLLRENWKKIYRIDLDLLVHPLFFRVLCSYLDQGISIWGFPVAHKGFLSSIREMERNTFASFFRTERAKKLLFNENCQIVDLLKLLIGDETLYKQYLYDQQFAHQGWSGIVSVLEDQPQLLLDRKKISLRELIIFELLLEIDALDDKYQGNWAPMASRLEDFPTPIFAKVPQTEFHEVIEIWQEAFEWSLYDQVLAGLKQTSPKSPLPSTKTFQAMFCMDDRECSIRRYVEKNDSHCQTFGTPGFFGVEFYYKPKHANSITKQCPAPVTPKYLIKELTSEKEKKERDLHFAKHTHTLLSGWLISQTLGFWSALRLALTVFKPSLSPATSSSFKHMDESSELTIENANPADQEDGLQIGFTVEEMATRVENLLRSIGLVNNFAPLVYAVGHGSTSVNNTHYAGYDCGACSGRPGSVNARVISYMANHLKVRALLKERGIDIPETTQFLGALHDTTRDEIAFYDTALLSPTNAKLHQQNEVNFSKALDLNAKERSRRFESIDSHLPVEKVHEKIRRRSVSLFEPRPELNHATNALCIVGRRDISKHLFLDRRSFMNSFDYRVDPEGKYLTTILNAVAPVAGGINLEYYFSRVDNQKLGAGTKLAHNVMGLFGVANGIDGDLRPGLPSQMIEVHDPVRLMVIVEHFPKVVLQSIQQSSATYEWFMNQWIHLMVVEPLTNQLYLFKDGEFVEYQPIKQSIKVVENIPALVEDHEDNLPIYLLK